MLVKVYRAFCAFLIPGKLIPTLRIGHPARFIDRNQDVDGKQLVVYKNAGVGKRLKGERHLKIMAH